MLLQSIYWYLIVHLPSKSMMRIMSRLSTRRALDAANAVLRVFPDDECAMVVKLYALYGMGLFGDALAYSERALVIHPQNSALHGVRGNVLAHYGRTDEALVEYDNVLVLHPNQPAALMHKGVLLGEQGHIDLALMCFDDIIEDDRSTSGDIFSASAEKGSLLAASQRITDLRDFCAELAAEHGNSPSILSMVGAFYCQAGDTETGVHYYRRARDCARSNPAMAAELTSIIADLEAGSVDDETLA